MNLLKSFELSYALLLSLILFFSCDNISSSQTDTNTKHNASNKLKRFAYKSKSSKNMFQSDAQSEIAFDKSLSIFTMNHEFKYEDDVESYQFASIDLFYLKNDSGSLAFGNPKFGTLELKSGADWFEFPEDSLDGGDGDHGSGTDSLDDDFENSFPYYSWFQEETDLPSELQAGATPEFSATVEETQSVSKTLSALPELTTKFSNLTSSSKLSFDTDFKITFNTTLEKGSFVGLQVITDYYMYDEDSDCENDSNDYSTPEIDSNTIDMLYLEIELTESANSVTFTKESLADLKTKIDDLKSEGIEHFYVDVFALNIKKLDEIPFTLKNVATKLDIVNYSSSSVTIEIE